MARHERHFERADPVPARATRGQVSYLAGMAAEDAVQRAYVAAGYTPIATRWRGRRGEIDLIFATCRGVVMVEVKASKDFGRAASHISAAQVQRLYTTAEEFLETQPKGNLTDIRFDVALVDQTGALRIFENAFAHMM